MEEMNLEEFTKDINPFECFENNIEIQEVVDENTTTQYESNTHLEQPIEVYVKVNENNEIVNIDSSIFIKDLTGWVKIDEGLGYKYSHAQVKYLSKPLLSKERKYNYKLVDGKVVENL